MKPLRKQVSALGVSNDLQVSDAGGSISGDGGKSGNADQGTSRGISPRLGANDADAQPREASRSNPHGDEFTLVWPQLLLIKQLLQSRNQGLPMRLSELQYTLSQNNFAPQQCDGTKSV